MPLFSFSSLLKKKSKSVPTESPDLIPLCHPLALSKVDIELAPLTDAIGIACHATVKTSGQTGVEMEALTAVQITLLTIYDMCKAVDKQMCVSGIRLVEKTKGSASC